MDPLNPCPVVNFSQKCSVGTAHLPHLNHHHDDPTAIAHSRPQRHRRPSNFIHNNPPHPPDCLPWWLFQRFSLRPLISAIHQMVVVALFLDPIHDNPHAIVHFRTYYHSRRNYQSLPTISPPSSDDSPSELLDVMLTSYMHNHTRHSRGAPLKWAKFSTPSDSHGNCWSCRYICQ
jgi:hypothetical protein